MKHEGSRQVGGYHSSADPPPVPTTLRKYPQTTRRRPNPKREPRPVRPPNPNAEFHRVLGQLRQALWNDDLERVPQLEQRIDNIVREWEANN